MVRFHDGRLHCALAVIPMYLVVLTPGSLHHLDLHPLRRFRKIRGTTKHLHMHMRLNINMRLFIHPVAIIFRTLPSASSDNFYDFYDV